MRKLFIMLLALVMAASMAVCAMADEWTMYANKSKVNVYAEPDETSEVVGKLKGGDIPLIDSKDGKWIAILLDAGDGQQLAWVRAEDLSDKMPPEFCNHEWGGWTVVTPASCTKAGLRTATCTVCGESTNDQIDKLPHNYGDWKVTKKATCTAEGERVRTCADCGYEQKKSIEKEPHDYGKWTVTKEATCTREGERYRVCNNCDYKQTQTIEKLPHEYGSWTILRDPTCTEKGQRSRTCKVCGYENKQDIDKLPHDYELRVLVETTDHSAGLRAKICKNCGYDGGQESFDPQGTLRRGARGDSVRAMQQLLADQGYLKNGGVDGTFGRGTENALKQFQTAQGLTADGIAWPQTLKRLKHDFGPWQTIKEMTRTESGERVRVCKDCGYTQHETVDAGASYARGSRGEDIRIIQRLINDVGYNAGSADGIYGRKLDRAFADFAAARGLTVVDGKVRPGDVDALVTAWMEKNRPATNGNLLLTVTPTTKPDENGIITFYWTLTNADSDAFTVYAMLLSFGDTPDFTKNTLAVMVSGSELKATGKTGATGMFNVDQDWGQGNMNFAILAVSKNGSANWLSIPVTYAQKAPAKTVEPLPTNININALANGVYPVAFNPLDVSKASSGIYMNGVQVYAMDTYDKAAIESLATDDTIIVGGEACTVYKVENRDGIVVINGGLDAAGGYEFTLTDSGDAYRVLMYDDLATYSEVGTTTLSMATTATYTDASNLDADPVTVGFDEIVSALQGTENAFFDQYNTTVRIESGRVVELNRIYTP